MKTEYDLGLARLAELGFLILHISALVATWSDPNFGWYRILSLVIWIIILLFVFFVAGITKEETENNNFTNYMENKYANEEDDHRKEIGDEGE